MAARSTIQTVTGRNAAILADFHATMKATGDAHRARIKRIAAEGRMAIYGIGSCGDIRAMAEKLAPRAAE